MAPSSPRPAASRSGTLPHDALYEVLLRLPAKELCRLRAVCRSWRALTSDPLFVAAHKSRHTGPLLAMAYRDGNDVHGVDIVDLSGNVLRRIPCNVDDIVSQDESGRVFVLTGSSETGINVLRTHLDLICFTRECRPWGLWVLNPASGATLTLPEYCPEELEHGPEVHFYRKVESHAFGKVSSTGEYKALRITNLGDPGRQLCEVITLYGSNHGRWRAKQDPPALICTSGGMKCVVIDGMVYFLIDFHTTYFHTGVLTVEPGSIASFNLETEEWMGTLQAPVPVRRFVQDSENRSYAELDLQLSLAQSNGGLVTVHNIHNISMDLWFLTDFEKCLWVKKYSIPSPVATLFVYPLLVLDDGQILLVLDDRRIFFGHEKGSLHSYDPRNGTCAHVLEMGDSRSIGIYTGSLLTL